MVSIGFIVEGATEKLLIDSPSFRTWCKSNSIYIVEPIIDAGGSGNLLPQNIDTYLSQIIKNEPHKIVVLTDLEREQSVQEVRDRILTDRNSNIDIVFVAIKAIEAWMLADSVALAKWLKAESVYEQYPEKTEGMPWDRLREIASEHNARGTGPSKVVFAKRYIKHCGFSLERAAEHPNCLSAKEFVDTLKQWAL